MARLARTRVAGLIAVAAASALCHAQDPLDLPRLLREAPRQLDPLPERPPTRALDPTAGKLAGDLLDQINAQAPDRALAADASIAILVTCPTPAAAARVAATLRASAPRLDGPQLLVRLRPELILALAASPDVAFVSAQPALAPSGVPDLAGALKTMKVAALHETGLQGGGIRIGIIDLGFDDYDALRRSGRLPAPAASATFGQPGANASPHGTACAEIVHAVAPEARLYLARIDGSDQSLLEAADWLAAQRVDVVNLSAGSYAHELRGRDRLSRAVDLQMRRDNRVWVVAAGNFAGTHWVTSVAPRATGSWIPIGPLGEILFPLAPPPGPAGSLLDVVVQWDDWTAAGGNATGQDIDACLYTISTPGAPPARVRCARDRQSENPAVPPLERLRLPSTSGKPTPYYLALYAQAVTHPVRLHVFVGPDGARPALHNPAGSVAAPATAAEALAVGALSPGSGEIAPYSSQGPTDDARCKPDVVAPTGFATAVHPDGFEGTSAATPLVTGYAALLAGRDVTLRGHRLRDAVLRSVAALGAPTPNNVFGHGLVGAIREGDSPADPLAPWGGAVPDSLLSELFDRDSANGPLSGRVVTGRDSYQAGDGLKLGVRVVQDCAVLLFIRAPGGAFHLLPLPTPDPLLAAGRPYRFPAGEATFSLDTAAPGQHDLLLIMAPRPLDWRRWREPDAVLGVAHASFQVIP